MNQGCPHKLPTPDTWHALMCADVFRNGCPPVPGGSLDQTKVFVESCRVIWSEQDLHRLSAIGPLALLR